MCIPLINSHKLSETRLSVYEIVYILSILVGSFFRELRFHLDFIPGVFVLG